MRSKYTLLHLLAGCLLMLSCNTLRAQLYVGNGGDVYISSGEQLFINGNLDLKEGAVITSKSIAGINLTGLAFLDGAMEYTSLGPQYILPFDHQSLVVNGSGNKTLTSGITINNLLQLGGTAKLVTGNYILSLPGGSTFSGMAPFGTIARSWVVTGNGISGVGNAGLGGLKIAGIGSTGRSGRVMFPVGPTDASYNPVTIQNTGATDDFTVTVNDQPVPGAVGPQSAQATWNISESVAGGSNVTLETQWNLENEAAGFIRAVCGLVHSNGTTIDYAGNTGSASGTNPYTHTGSGFTAFSPFGVTSNASVLPVQFLGVKAFRQGTNIRVEWEVTSETSIRYYEVQKSSNGVDFSSIGQLTATGNAVNRQIYPWLDLTPFTGENFYRIKSVGINGYSSFSNIAKVMYTSVNASVTAYPNPVVNYRFSLEFNNQAAGNYNIRIISLSGQLVYENRLRHNGVNRAYPVQLPVNLTRSMYQMTVEAENGSINSIKLVIHR